MIDPRSPRRVLAERIQVGGYAVFVRGASK